jgi:hypothetical protein
MVTGRRGHQHFPFAVPVAGPSGGISLSGEVGVVVVTGVVGVVDPVDVTGVLPRAVGSSPPRGPPAVAGRPGYHDEVLW